LPFSAEKSKQIYERTLGVLIEASSSCSRMRPADLLYNDDLVTYKVRCTELLAGYPGW
jgi:hypothetical protein